MSISYPFDIQDLSFIITTDLSINRVIFVESRYKPDALYINKSFLALSEWDIVYYDVSSFYIDWQWLNGKKEEFKAKLNHLQIVQIAMKTTAWKAMKPLLRPLTLVKPIITKWREATGVADDDSDNVQSGMVFRIQVKRKSYAFMMLYLDVFNIINKFFYICI